MSCKLSHMETICMKCQILFFPQKYKTYFSIRLLKILPRVLSAKWLVVFAYLVPHIYIYTKTSRGQPLFLCFEKIPPFRDYIMQQSFHVQDPRGRGIAGFLTFQFAKPC